LAFKVGVTHWGGTGGVKKERGGAKGGGIIEGGKG